MSTMQELVLAGCTPTPLAGYLKALGVLRLLGEQKPEWAIHGAWREDQFVLSSSVFSGDLALDRARVLDFFLDEYRPTPIVAPWNGGSGFFPKDNRKGIDALADSRAARYLEYRQAIEFCRSTVSDCSLSESPKDEEKAEFLTLVRAGAPESMLAWMDAAILIASDGPQYPPLLGTGGNDGRLDFTNNFMQQIADLVVPESGEASLSAKDWLPAALFEDIVASLSGGPIGQFYPGGAGGPNASTGYGGGSLFNPWDFVLMLEGALLFITAATRCLEHMEPGQPSFPFTVYPTGAGSGGVDPEDESPARAEIWVPLWSGAATPLEIRRLLAEGRVTLGRRSARDGLGFARAVAALGVDRGISAFQRYGFLMRSGKAYLATPLNRIAVRRNPDADLIDELEAGGFLDKVQRFARGKEAPARFRGRVAQLQNALFELTQRADPRTLQAVLIHMGALSSWVGKSRKGREDVPPVPTLSERWVLQADDGTPEFRIAAALAGLHGAGLPMCPFLTPVVSVQTPLPNQGASGGNTLNRGDTPAPVGEGSERLPPVKQKQKGQKGWDWDPGSRLAVWGEGDFIGNLYRVIARRHLEATRARKKDRAKAETGAEDAGTATPSGHPFERRFGVSSGDIAAFLEGNLDEVRLSKLFLGLVHARIPYHLISHGEIATLPAAYAVLKTFFSPVAEIARHLPEEKSLTLPAEFIAKLQAGHVQETVNLAWRRLRATGFPVPTYPNPAPSSLDIEGPRLLAALAIPLASADLTRCLGDIGCQKPTHPPETT